MNKKTYNDFAEMLGYTAFDADYRTITKGKNPYSSNREGFSKNYSVGSMNKLYKEANGQ